MRMIIGNELM